MNNSNIDKHFLCFEELMDLVPSNEDHLLNQNINTVSNVKTKNK
jgi:hypothetical protein